MRYQPPQLLFPDLDQKWEGHRPGGFFGIYLYARHPVRHDALPTLHDHRGRTIGRGGVAFPSRFFLHPQAPRTGGLQRGALQQYLQPAHALYNGRYPQRTGASAATDAPGSAKSRNGPVRAVGLLPQDLFDHHLPRQGQATARSAGRAIRRKRTLYPPKTEKPDRDPLPHQALRRGVCRPAEHKPQSAGQDHQEPF